MVKRNDLFRFPSMSADGTWTNTYWPLYAPRTRDILTLSTTQSTVLEGHAVRRCAFWSEFYPQLGDVPSDLICGANNSASVPANEEMFSLDLVLFYSFSFVLLCLFTGWVCYLFK